VSIDVAMDIILDYFYESALGAIADEYANTPSPLACYLMVKAAIERHEPAIKDAIRAAMSEITTEVEKELGDWRDAASLSAAPSTMDEGLPWECWQHGGC
jgi:hypothetical protein